MNFNITPVDEEIYESAKERTAALAMPLRAMGRINDLSEKLCAIQGTLTPDVSRRALFIMAGDHGVYKAGVAPYPQEVTMQMMQMMLEGRSSACVYAKHANTAVILTDMGTLGDVTLPKKKTCTFYDKKIARGTGDFTKGPAMSREEAEKSILTGREIASKHIKKDKLNLITIGEMGIANTTPSAAIAAVYTRQPAREVTGYGSGVDKDGWFRKVDAVQKGIEINKPLPTDPIGVLAGVGGFEIGGMAGVILAAAEHKVPVVLDGFISTAAAMIAATIAPKSKGYMIAGHQSEEAGHRHLLAKLGLTPLLQLGIRLGEGTGAVCAVPLLEMAAATITEIATLDDAGVNK